jgi:hypothetical protein
VTHAWAMVGKMSYRCHQVNAMTSRISNARYRFWGLRARTLKSFILLPLLLAAPCALLAQTPAAPSAPEFLADGLSIRPQNGQAPQQQVTDRTECEAWSKGQTGFDITQPTGGVAPSDYTSRREQFNRAMTACLEARGYAVRIAAPVTPPASAAPRYSVPAPAAPTYVTHYSPPEPTLKYHPFSVSISGGWNITTGTVNQNYDDGGLGALAFSLFPAESLPIGLRLDGSYSWFGARDQFLIANNAQLGHQEVYGADADLQFNLGPHTARSQLYLFGGAGWYRERTTLHQVSAVNGTICGFFFCGSSDFFAITGTARATTPWRDSWNAGLGWEIAMSDVSSFFVEARYRQIGPNDSKEAFVPIQAGFRF